jgi:hypothetical protein
MADYIDRKSGRFDATKQVKEHCNIFPTLWILVQSQAAIQNIEIVCESIFSLTSYISAPRCAYLCIHTHEHITILANILKKVYIGKEWTTKEYLRCCKTGAWKKKNTVDTLKCWNLEFVLDDELEKLPVSVR